MYKVLYGGGGQQVANCIVWGALGEYFPGEVTFDHSLRT